MKEINRRLNEIGANMGSRGPEVKIIEGPIIDSNSVQAKIHPEIANTKCFITDSCRRVARRINRKHFGEKYYEFKNTHSVAFICHKCDNSHCVNPLHVFLGTGADNIQDCLKKNRHPQKGTKLTDEQKRKTSYYTKLAMQDPEIKKKCAYWKGKDPKRRETRTCECGKQFEVILSSSKRRCSNHCSGINMKNERK